MKIDESFHFFSSIVTASWPGSCNQTTAFYYQKSGDAFALDMEMLGGCLPGLHIGQPVQ